ncbi:MAG: hypothetical protein K8R53_14665 [Bacteroidales bacterium]|nr:hypothetical protein [Bacteroidales bacterium]
MSYNTIKEVFTKTCWRYEQMLEDYYPSHGNTGFTERNITFNFCCAFLKENNDENLIIWQEVPIKDKEDKSYRDHIDSLIIDDKNRTLFLIEAKRLNETEKMNSIRKDFKRLKNNWSSINFGKKEDRKSYHKYLLILADFWKPDKKKEPNKKQELFDWFKDFKKNEHPDYLYQKIEISGRKSTEKELKEQYYLMYKAWKLDT